MIKNIMKKSFTILLIISAFFFAKKVSAAGPQYQQAMKIAVAQLDTAGSQQQFLCNWPTILSE